MYNQTHNTMAKIYGINGVITGKLGAAVYAVRNGEQISRQYQPIVANPQTAGQTAARAKLKLLSQLSSVFGSVIAIPREGAVSSRNLFTKDNYPLASYAGSKANIDLTAIQVTRSIVALPALNVSSSAGTVTMSLSEGDPDVDRVVYIIMQRTADEKLRLWGSVVSDTPGTLKTFQYVVNISAGSNVVVYAYGIRSNTEAGRAIFGNLNIPTAQDIAQIVVSRRVLDRDLTLTETRAAEITVE